MDPGPRIWRRQGRCSTGMAGVDNFRDLLEEKAEEWEPRSPLWKIENLAANPAWRGVMLLKETEAANLARRGQEEPAFIAACDLLGLLVVAAGAHRCLAGIHGPSARGS